MGACARSSVETRMAARADSDSTSSYIGAGQSFPMLHDQPCRILRHPIPHRRQVISRHRSERNCLSIASIACESGFIPGAVVMTSHFYTSKELAIRLCWFWSTLNVARVCSALLAAGILQMRGIAGRPGWFWLFVSRLVHTYGCAFPVTYRFP